MSLLKRPMRIAPVPAETAQGKNAPAPTRVPDRTARLRLFEDAKLFQPRNEMERAGVDLFAGLGALEQMHYLIAPIHSRPHFVLAQEHDGVIDVADDAAVDQMELGREVVFRRADLLTLCRRVPPARRGAPPCGGRAAD